MSKIDMNWVYKQLTDNKTNKNIGDVVVNLLKSFNAETIELTPEQTKEAIEYFSKLSLGQPIYIPIEKEEIWVDARPGQIKIGDEVLVKVDAYTLPDVATIHNGRRGKIVAIRYGDIIVKYTDNKEPKLENARHSPHSLLKLVNNG